MKRFRNSIGVFSLCVGALLAGCGVSSSRTGTGAISIQSGNNMVDLSQAVGRKWTFTGATFQFSGSVAPSASNKPYLEFDFLGGIKGSSGCNSFSGNITVAQGQHPKVANLISTMMSCADLTLESRLLSLLINEFDLQISGSQLSFVGTSLGEMARFNFEIENVAGSVPNLGGIVLSEVAGRKVLTLTGGKSAYETLDAKEILRQRLERNQIIEIKPIPINTGRPGINPVLNPVNNTGLPNPVPNSYQFLGK